MFAHFLIWFRTHVRFAVALSCASTGLLAATSTSPAADTTRVPVQRSLFGRTSDGVEIESFTLTNRHGSVAKVITYGAILAALHVPDRDGKLAGVVNEISPSEASFQRGFARAGAVYGRVANRIAHARFTLDGREIRLPANSAPHHIHGGSRGFNRVVWQASIPDARNAAAVKLTYQSPNGEGGYPGNLTASVLYTLTDENTLRLDYSAVTDQPTPVNFTNHAYFNLAGGGDVLEHELMLNADHYTVFDADLIPTGEIKNVKGTPFDLTQLAPLGSRAAQLGGLRRYDQNFVLNRPVDDVSLQLAARVYEPKSGRLMEAWTTEPGVQLLTTPLTKSIEPDRAGFFCLETQHFPDSVNHPHFPSTILRPGETYRSTTEFRFSAK